MEQILKGTREDSKWNPLFMLLSTERVEPFLREIGLTLPHLEAVRECARRYVEDYNSGPGGDWTWYEPLLKQTFACIEEAAGPETAQYLYRWAVDQFHYADEYEYSSRVWEILLRGLAKPSKPRFVPLTLPAERSALIKEAVVDHYWKDFWSVRERVKAIDTQPLSGWDHYLYQLYRTGATEDASPLDILLDVVAQQHLRKVWETVRSLLTSEEMQALLEWGRTQARQYGMTLPEKLPD